MAVRASLRCIIVVSIVSLLLSITPAGAQDTPRPDVRLSVAPETEPVPPGADGGPATVNLRLVCALPEHVPPGPEYVIRLSVATDEEGVAATVHPEDVVFDPDECAVDGAVDKQVEVRFDVADDAQGGAFFLTTLAAVAPDARTWSVQWEQETAVVLNATASIDHAYQKAGQNARIGYPLTVANNGNTDIRVTVQRVEGEGEVLDVVLPGPLHVEPGGQVTIKIDVRTPFKNGVVSRNDSFALDVTFSTDTEPAVENTTRLVAHAETKGAYVPGPAPLLVVLLLAGLGAAMRRRH